MLTRLANVLFYTSIICSLVLLIIGVFSFDMIAFLICISLSTFLSLFGWSIRYILTGEKHIHPTIAAFLNNKFQKIRGITSPIISNLKQKDEWVETPYHPWRRYFARILDISVNGMLIFFCLGLILGIIAPNFANDLFSTLSTDAGQLLDIILTIFISTFLTAALIGKTGSSLGKYLFGIRVKNKSDSPIGYFHAWKREIDVFVRGLGLGMPIVSLFTIYSAYKKLLKDGKTSWDQKGEYRIIYRNNNLKQWALNILGFILLLIVIAYTRSL